MSKKPLIVFEGIEASGKSTSLQKAINYLKKNKIKYIAFREPGGTKFSEDLRSLILNKKSKLNNKTDLFLLMASRSENIDKRSIDSTRPGIQFGLNRMGLDTGPKDVQGFKDFLLKLEQFKNTGGIK